MEEMTPKRGMAKLSEAEKPFVSQCKSLASILADDIPNLRWSQVRAYIESRPDIAPQNDDDLRAFRAKEYIGDDEFVTGLKSFLSTRRSTGPAGKGIDEARRETIRSFIARHFDELKSPGFTSIDDLAGSWDTLNEVGRVLINAYLLGQRDRPRRGVGAAQNAAGEWFYTEWNEESGEAQLTTRRTREDDIEWSRTDASDELINYLRENTSSKKAPVYKGASIPMPVQPPERPTSRPVAVRRQARKR